MGAGGDSDSFILSTLKPCISETLAEKKSSGEDRKTKSVCETQNMVLLHNLMKSNILLSQEHSVQRKESGLLTKANELHVEPQMTS